MLGKWLVILCFSLFITGLAFHFIPSIAGTGMNVGGLYISVWMVMFVGGIIAGHKLTSK